MGTKLSSPGNRRHHPSSVTTNGVRTRGQVDVSGRNRARSLQLNDSHSMAIPTRGLQRLDISSEDNSPSPDSDGVSLLQARSLPGQLFALHGLRCPVCSKFVPTDQVELHFVICLTKPRLVYNGICSKYQTSFSQTNYHCCKTLPSKGLGICKSHYNYVSCQPPSPSKNMRINTWKVQYDVLTQDSGECVICLDDLLIGDKIARLPCLCIYHKRCIDMWFEKNRSCPEHPS